MRQNATSLTHLNVKAKCLIFFLCTSKDANVKSSLLSCDERKISQIKKRGKEIKSFQEIVYSLQWRSKLDNWGWGAIFIYSCSQTMKTIDFKGN